MLSFVRALLCSATAFFLVLMLSATAATASPKSFSIDAQEAPRALLEFGRQSAVQILFATEKVKGVITNAVHGNYEPIDALNLLLKGTTLVASEKPGGVLVVEPQVKARSTSNAIPMLPKDAENSPRLTQSNTTSTQYQSGPDAPQNTSVPDSKSKGTEKTGLEEIVVTGTHIPGITPTSPLITLSREDIDVSGYTSVGDVIRSLPQSWAGGLNPNVVGAPGTVNQGAVSGAESTVDLRGLGPESTLTLINGHRIAFSGFTSSVDISAIPLAAVQRIELLTDGASAIYGADAVAGVANFIMRKDYDGADTLVRVGKATEGEPKETQFSQLFGKTWTGGSALVSYEHTQQSELYSSDRSYTATAAQPLSLLPYQRADSVFFSGHQSFNERVSIYADGLYSERQGNIVSNSGGFVAYNFTKTKLFGLAAGLEGDLGGGWVTSIDANLSKGRNDQSYYFVSGGMVLFPGENFYDNHLASLEVRAAGPALELPSGPVNLAIGAGYRKEEFQLSSEDPELRHLKYGFAELHLPIVRPSKERIGLERLEVSAAARYENYSDFGTATKPQFGLLYSPIDGLSIRGSWSQSFRAPDLTRIFGPRSVFVYPPSFVGSTVPNAQYLLQNGANLGLKPETSTSWTAGISYIPSLVPEFRATATYYHIDYKNRITQPINILQNALSDPTYAPFVTSNPSPAQQAAVIAQATEFLSAIAAPYDPSKVLAILNDTYQNAAAQSVHGVDLLVEQRWTGPYGNVRVTANAAWEHIAQRLTATSSEQTISGIIFSPPNFKARLGATWNRGAWSVSSFLNYVGDETDTTQLSNVHVSSWTTVDAQARYDLSNLGKVTRGTGISVSVRNAFDRDPPRISPNSALIPGLEYDSANASPIGRFVTLAIDKVW